MKSRFSVPLLGKGLSPHSPSFSVISYLQSLRKKCRSKSSHHRFYSRSGLRCLLDPFGGMFRKVVGITNIIFKIGSNERKCNLNRYVYSCEGLSAVEQRVFCRCDEIARDWQHIKNTRQWQNRNNYLVSRARQHRSIQSRASKSYLSCSTAHRLTWQRERQTNVS